jgi:membrane protein DedA with SNARE-associated domain
MQQSSLQVVSGTNQLNFKRFFRIVAFVGVVAAFVGISLLGSKAGRVATNETADQHSSAAAAFATSRSSELLNGMPLP